VAAVAGEDPRVLKATAAAKMTFRARMVNPLARLRVDYATVQGASAVPEQR
jgi:hypothetical protein